MFQFPAFASYPYVFEGKIPYNNAWKPKPSLNSVWIFQASKVGFPIRRSMDQSSFAAPHGLSQRITSFFACACQGIHQMPLRHLIVLIANAHHLLGLEFLSSSLALEGVPNLTIRTSRIRQTQKPGYLLQPDPINDAIDVFNQVTLLELRRAAHLCLILRPASRDQIRVRAVSNRTSIDRQNQNRSPEAPVTATTTDQSDRLPTSPGPSLVSGRLGHRRYQRNRLRTWAHLTVKPRPGSLQINLLFTMYAEQAQG